MNIEAMGKHQHIAFLEVRGDILLIHRSLELIIDQDHDDIRFLRRFRCSINLKSLALRPLPGLAAFIEADNDMETGILQVQRMSVSLGTVTDDRDRRALKQ